MCVCIHVSYLSIRIYLPIYNYAYFNHLCQRNIALDGVKEAGKTKIIEVGIKTIAVGERDLTQLH